MLDLRTALRLDAAASGAMGVLLLMLLEPAESALGLPVALSLPVVALLLGWAALVGWVSTHLRPSWVKEVIALNVVYVALSVVFALSGWASLTGLGVAFVLVQATAVVVLTVLQVAGQRTDRTTVAA